MSNINRKKLKQYLREIKRSTYHLYVQDKSREANIAAAYWVKSKINIAKIVLRKLELKRNIHDMNIIQIVMRSTIPVYIPGKLDKFSGSLDHIYTVTTEMLFKVLLNMGVEKRYIKLIKILSPENKEKDQYTIPILSCNVYKFFDMPVLQARVVYISNTEYYNFTMNFFVAPNVRESDKYTSKFLKDFEEEEDRRFYEQFL